MTDADLIAAVEVALEDPEARFTSVIKTLRSFEYMGLVDAYDLAMRGLRLINSDRANAVIADQLNHYRN